MRIQFEGNLDYQLQAIEAVCDLFKGQEVSRTEFTVSRPRPSASPQAEMFAAGTLGSAAAQGAMGFDDPGLGIGNRLALLPEQVLANLQAVQLRNALAPAPALEGRDFTVEMETGTGKTYVYLRTCFELNRRYGFTKFVVVVPSVAIREGVAKTLEMTADHFRALYAGTPMEWFTYDSDKLGQVRDFATSAGIKVMVATIGAINKMEQNRFYQVREELNDERPVDLVAGTRPVLVVDEPQSVTGGQDGAGTRALEAMRPLCTLRYSATHVDKHHMVYRLDAVDAYERQLVKRIDVAGLAITGAGNAPYVKLLEVRTAKNKPPLAKVELDAQELGGVRRVVRTVQDGDDLGQATHRDVYAGLSIGTIEGGKGRTALLQLNVPGDVRYLKVGEAHADVDRDAVVRQMVARTIREHFERERVLKPLGIKVLSLFFVDRVEHYRRYAEDGSRTLGKYGVMFEEEYRRLAAHPDFARTLFAAGQPDPAQAHDGYFSRDKKGRVTEPELNAAGELKNQASRDDAERGYKLIMRDKERLLGEDEPLRFIFSHSALREGWDNPNVFQICALREMGGDRERRQTIGRGLRLCVDRAGNRRRDAGLNVLTVVADEGYASFAEGLQRQVEADLGIRFGVVEPETFAALSYARLDGTVAPPLGVEASATLAGHLRAAGYLDAKGAIQDSLRTALRTGTLTVPPQFAPVAPAVRALLSKLAGKLDVGNADNRRQIALNREVFLSDEFRALWDRVKARTTYRVGFDPDALVADAAKRIAELPPVARPQLQWTKAQLSITEAGIAGENVTTSAFHALDAGSMDVPDVLGELQDRTGLTRRSLARILVDSGRLEDLKLNPAAFLDQAASCINAAKTAALVDGVRYQPVDDHAYWCQELFQKEEVIGYLGKMVDVRKAATEQIAYQSNVERSFAEGLDANEAVRVFAKLPGWFKVATPLGSYNPDWIVVVATEAGDRLYFVVETKGTQLAEDLRRAERDRIRCGEKHFQAIAAAPGEPEFRQETDAARFLAYTAQKGMEGRRSNTRIMEDGTGDG